MHSLAATNLPRLSETELKWFMFETACYAFGGRIRRFAKVKVTKGSSIIVIIFTSVHSVRWGEGVKGDSKLF